MKIIHITSVHSLFDVRIFHKQALSLYKSGHEVHLIVASNEEYSGIYSGVVVHVVAKNNNKYFRFFSTGLSIFLKSLSIKGDIFHFHDPELIPWFLLLKSFRRRVVMDVHENYVNQILGKKWMPKLFRILFSKLVYFFEYLAVNTFEGVITTDSELTKSFKNLSNKTTIITANNFPSIDADILAANFSINKYKKNIVLSLGGVSKARCADILIQALPCIENIKYKIFMGGHENDQSLLQALKNSKEWHNVNFIGSVPFKDMSNLLIESSMSINMYADLPNHYGNRSNRLFEAMSAGLPVIVSDFGETASFVRKYNCGIAVNPVNPIDVSTAIVKLLSDPEYAMKLGLNGRSVVLKSYTWDKEFDKIIRLYEEIT